MDSECSLAGPREHVLALSLVYGRRQQLADACISRQPPSAAAAADSPRFSMSDAVSIEPSFSQTCSQRRLGARLERLTQLLHSSPPVVRCPACPAAGPCSLPLFAAHNRRFQDLPAPACHVVRGVVAGSSFLLSIKTQLLSLTFFSSPQVFPKSSKQSPQLPHHSQHKPFSSLFRQPQINHNGRLRLLFLRLFLQLLFLRLLVLRRKFLKLLGS